MLPPNNNIVPASISLSYEQLEYMQEVQARRQQCLANISRLPIAALIWGPTPSATSVVGRARIRLREELLRNNYLADFSEDLVDPTSIHSVFAQQLAQAEGSDIIFSLPDSPGSIAEIHDFARLPKVAHKIVTFLDEQWNSGYANQSLLQLETTITSKIQVYDSSQLPDCIIERALDCMNRLREVHYALGRRI